MGSKFLYSVVRLSWGNYTVVLKKHPFITQSITTGVIMASGDVIAQGCFSRDRSYDGFRTAKFFGMGTLMIGPWLHLWYGFMNKVVKGPPVMKTLKMVCIDQIVMAPILVAVYLCVYGALNRCSTAEIGRKLKQDYPGIMIDNYKVWPAAQLINFYAVPIDFRVLFANCVALMWNIYLSYTVNKSPQE